MDIFGCDNRKEDIFGTQIDISRSQISFIFRYITTLVERVTDSLEFQSTEQICTTQPQSQKDKKI